SPRSPAPSPLPTRRSSDLRVESTDVAVDREKARVTITFTIVEGPQFRVGTLKLAGVTLLPEPEVQRQLTLKSGDVTPASLSVPRSEEHTSELQSPDHLVCS